MHRDTRRGIMRDVFVSSTLEDKTGVGIKGFIYTPPINCSTKACVCLHVCVLRRSMCYNIVLNLYSVLAVMIGNVRK